MTDRTLCTVADGIADVRLNRPDKLNAVDAAMFVALADAGGRIATDPTVRVVVLSGEGRGFCAGLDLSSFQAPASAADDANEVDSAFAAAVTSMTDRLPGKITNLFQEAVHVWTALEMPVIAACTGPVLGVGLQLALGAAMTWATEIASKNPHAIRGMKSLFEAAGTRPLVESLIEESRLMGSLLGSPNQTEAVMAYFEKRDPAFVDQ